MNNLFAQYTDYNYSYETTDVAAEMDPATGAAIAGGAFLFMLIAFVISYVITSFLLGKVFKKAGVEQWKAWVPVYNTWILLQLGGQQGFWAILGLIPVIQIVSVVYLYIAAYHIGLKLGKSGSFVLLAIFLPLVWAIWLGFDDSKWPGKKVTATKADTPEKKTEK